MYKWKTHRVWIMYIIMFYLAFLTINELTAERNLIMRSPKLYQHEYFKGILTSKFGSKDIYYFEKDVLLLFTQKMITYAFLPK